MGRPERPLDPDAGPTQRFAHALRRLRQDAGSPTYRDLSTRTEFSAPTLSAAAAGSRLPSPQVLRAYVTALGADATEWEKRRQEAAEEEALLALSRPGGLPTPYLGLARYGTDDHALFFGRAELVSDLIDLVARRRLSALVGASGSGKSSLIRAGLVPALQQLEPEAGRPSAVRIFSPGEHPARDHRELFSAPDAPGDCIVLIDQFEELFTICHDAAERAEFTDLLLTAVAPENNVRVVLAMRADFYGRCAEHQGLAEALSQGHLLVSPMSREQLRSAIVKPAAVGRLVVERSLTTQILDDVSDVPGGGLPLMSHALFELWKRRDGHILSKEAYDAIGGVHGALAHTAEQFFAGLTDEQACLARTLLLRLVAPGEGTQDTARPTPRSELSEIEGSAPVLELLISARIIVVDGVNVSLAHEVLISAWPRLHGWIEADRDRLRMRRRIADATQVWNELNRDPGALYRGGQLAVAQEMFALDDHVSDDLSPAEREFLIASVEAHEQARREETRRERTMRVLVTVVVLLCITGVLLWVLWFINPQPREHH
ncbi:helix-turn-helix domain-containing protein [Actinomycetota bacterium Odt1-20B]